MAMEWLVSHSPVDYEPAVAEMERRAGAIRTGAEGEAVWLLEHPPLYTAGTSARPEDLLKHDIPVYKTGRGGQFTYHGPGQQIAYVMMDLKRAHENAPDLRLYISQLEDWIIAALDRFGLKGERREGRVGIWVPAPDLPGGEAKIAAIGVRIRKWVTMHGLALNANSDLAAFQGIVPCGLHGYGVTSLSRELGRNVPAEEAGQALKQTWPDVFAKD